MKTRFYGIWEIRHQRFYVENGLVFIYERVKDAKEEIETLGRYHPDGGVLRRVMPIYLTPYDNKQIFVALEIKE